GHPAASARLVESCDVGRAIRVLGFLPTDHRAAILAAAGADARARIDAALPEGDRATLERLLACPEGAVGRLTNPKIWRGEPEETAGTARARLRERADDIEVAVNCYVCRRGQPVGVVPLRRLAVAPPDTRLADLMTPDPLAVREDTSRSDAAEILRTHD